MPRVTDEHRQARRDQILDAGVATFAARGFQATGMAEIIAASGLSAGAVYSYFSGKDQLIEAIVDRILEEAGGRMDQLLGEGSTLDTPAAVGAAVAMFAEIAERGPVDISRLAVQAWGEALHNPAVQKVARRAYGRIRGVFAEVLRRDVRSGRLPDSLDVEAGSAVVLSLVLGFLVQRLLLGDVDPAGYGRAVAAVCG
jgi:AcrR family transcriptional regulator